MKTAAAGNSCYSPQPVIRYVARKMVKKFTQNVIH